MIREQLRKLGAVKTSLFITAIAVLFSALFYGAAGFAMKGISAVGIVMSTSIPAVVTPLLSYFLLKIMIKLDETELALAETTRDLEERIKQHTAELTDANEHLQIEIGERIRAECQIQI